MVSSLRATSQMTRVISFSESEELQTEDAEHTSKEQNGSVWFA